MLADFIYFTVSEIILTERGWNVPISKFEIFYFPSYFNATFAKSSS